MTIFVPNLYGKQTQNLLFLQISNSELSSSFRMKSYKQFIFFCGSFIETKFKSIFFSQNCMKQVQKDFGQLYYVSTQFQTYFVPTLGIKSNRLDAHFLHTFFDKFPKKSVLFNRRFFGRDNEWKSLFDNLPCYGKKSNCQQPRPSYIASLAMGNNRKNFCLYDVRNFLPTKRSMAIPSAALLRVDSSPKVNAFRGRMDSTVAYVMTRSCYGQKNSLLSGAKVAETLNSVLEFNDEQKYVIPLEYSLESFHRSNQDTCLLHKPTVLEGDWIQIGDLLADSSASIGGELSLGHNILIAYMPWEGFNYEDAILISERLVYDDVYTSVHIERYETEIRETKYGKEKITKEIPDLSEKDIKNLDNQGVCKIGTWVEEGDILIGKIAPINRNSQSPYQKLFSNILQTEFIPYKDNSFRAPKGIKAKVINVYPPLSNIIGENKTPTTKWRVRSDCFKSFTNFLPNNMTERTSVGTKFHKKNVTVDRTRLRSILPWVMTSPNTVGPNCSLQTKAQKSPKKFLAPGLRHSHEGTDLPIKRLSVVAPEGTTTRLPKSLYGTQKSYGDGAVPYRDLGIGSASAVGTSGSLQTTARDETKAFLISSNIFYEVTSFRSDIMTSFQKNVDEESLKLFQTTVTRPINFGDLRGLRAWLRPVVEKLSSQTPTPELAENGRQIRSARRLNSYQELLHLPEATTPSSGHAWPQKGQTNDCKESTVLSEPNKLSNQTFVLKLPFTRKKLARGLISIILNRNVLFRSTNSVRTSYVFNKNEECKYSKQTAESCRQFYIMSLDSDFHSSKIIFLPQILSKKVLRLNIDGTFFVTPFDSRTQALSSSRYSGIVPEGIRSVLAVDHYSNKNKQSSTISALGFGQKKLPRIMQSKNYRWNSTNKTKLHMQNDNEFKMIQSLHSLHQRCLSLKGLGVVLSPVRTNNNSVNLHRARTMRGKLVLCGISFRLKFFQAGSQASLQVSKQSHLLKTQSSEALFMMADSITTKSPRETLVPAKKQREKKESLEFTRSSETIKSKLVDANITTSSISVVSARNSAMDFVAPNGATRECTQIQIYLAEKRKIQIGDKMAGRHGNKGIVSQILPRQDMPYLPDGTPIDMVLNPLGVPSRMNVGQIYECLLGLAGNYLGTNFRIFPFDEIYGAEASRSFVYSKLYEARKKTGNDWLFDPNFPGKIRLFDGRNGDCFDQPVTLGQSYMLKLVHLVDDKIHARSTGPYSLVTQQPLRGRSKQGGQRLGEMEVWALEGYGAAFVLLEMLTIKSDNITGRLTLWSNLIINRKIAIGTPEAFKVLVSELQALCLNIGLFSY